MNDICLHSIEYSVMIVFLSTDVSDQILLVLLVEIDLKGQDHHCNAKTNQSGDENTS